MDQAGDRPRADRARRHAQQGAAGWKRDRRGVDGRAARGRGGASAAAVAPSRRRTPAAAADADGADFRRRRACGAPRRHSGFPRHADWRVDVRRGHLDRRADLRIGGTRSWPSAAGSAAWQTREAGGRSFRPTAMRSTRCSSPSNEPGSGRASTRRSRSTSRRRSCEPARAIASPAENREMSSDELTDSSCTGAAGIPSSPSRIRWRRTIDAGMRAFTARAGQPRAGHRGRLPRDVGRSNLGRGRGRRVQRRAAEAQPVGNHHRNESGASTPRAPRAGRRSCRRARAKPKT